jgi:hypothetical protein
VSDGPFLPSYLRTETSLIPVEIIKRWATSGNSLARNIASSEPLKLTAECRGVGGDALKNGH